ncbi:hypothetical protein CLOHAE12215_00188 [Clostridium haemolyticum]|nr:hypothetical protein CLOHAE12215_00188 [Clostridium haemolyticum]
MNNNKISINLKFLSSKWVFMTMIPIFIATFIAFNGISQNTCNVHDLILNVFNNYFTIFYLLYLLFSIFVLKIIVKQGFNSYIYIRFKTRNQWFFSKIKFIGLIALVYVLAIIGICALESIGHFSFSNSWSEFGLNYFKGSPIILKSTPLTSVFISSLLLFFYLFTFGLIIFVSSLFVKHNAFAFIIGFIINSINMMGFLMNSPLFYKIGFCHNTMLSLHKSGINSMKPSISYSFIYWIIVISILVLMGLKRINKIDFN